MTIAPRAETTVLLNDSLRLLLLEQFTVDELRHLADVTAKQCGNIPQRRRLSDESKEELADILLKGGRETIGFWKWATYRG